MWLKLKNRGEENLRSELKFSKLEIKNAHQLIQNLQGINNDKFELSDDIKDSSLIQSILNFKQKFEELANVERQQHWINEGLAKFAELLRFENKTESELYNQFTQSIVKYINANQAGLFLLNDNQQLVLKACYAYDRFKYADKTFEKGEGLIGQCVFEAETIFLTQLPPNYLSITSGLGEASPRCVVLLPIKLNKEVLGVLEIASFQVFEKFQINFLEKLSENIAAVVQQNNTSQAMKRLLNDAQENNEYMKQQEEEVRQNMEELAATQEEIIRRENETKIMFQNLKVEYDAKIEEIKNREIELTNQKDILMKALLVDNILIDVAGRNRMLSQKIAFLCEMVMAGKNKFIEELLKTIELHDKSLSAIKFGGQAPQASKDVVFEPANEFILNQIQKVESLWEPFKYNATTIANSSPVTQEAEDALKFIEDRGLELLKVNNELVARCIEYNNLKLQKSGLMNF